ncbi:hypothetical protein B0H17DRAFT_4138 [Mycena rosella]|uniref:Uncharacterized protein n=1 Tax=Mycena rosella TaxID=1033263 RepID=A0AAD7H2W9_MYCRO|nr:hypothetical protein B0H17DRAFT_4138 [Mycena rosella]
MRTQIRIIWGGMRLWPTRPAIKTFHIALAGFPTRPSLDSNPPAGQPIAPLSPSPSCGSLPAALLSFIHDGLPQKSRIAPHHSPHRPLRKFRLSGAIKSGRDATRSSAPSFTRHSLPRGDLRSYLHVLPVVGESLTHLIRARPCKSFMFHDHGGRYSKIGRRSARRHFQDSRVMFPRLPPRTLQLAETLRESTRHLPLSSFSYLQVESSLYRRRYNKSRLDRFKPDRHFHANRSGHQLRRRQVHHTCRWPPL